MFCMDTVLEFHAEALQTTVSEGLAQGSYVAARAGFKPTTLRTKGAESVNEPPCPACVVREYWGYVFRVSVYQKMLPDLSSISTPR